VAAAAAQPSTFWQRVKAMEAICGPSSWWTLLAPAAELNAAADVVRRHAAGAAVPPDTLQRAEQLRAAALHPDTGQPIALPLRMAAHVPANTVLLIGMLTARSVAATAAWQFANQSFNALQFYANRNASNEVSDAKVLASYAGAVASSVTVGVLLRRAALRAEAAAANLPPSHPARWRAWAANLAVPFMGAAAGKPLQIGLMRSDEVTDGVTVYDAAGDARGRSAAAGRAAVGMTVATRTVYLVPMLYLPVLQSWLVNSAFPALGRSSAAAGAVYVAITALSSAYATPLCIALFDQRASLPAAALEPALQGLADRHGRPVERLYFNKGL
jgi:hypothetical protein